MSDSITNNERAALKSALATGGQIRFETWGHNRCQVAVVDGVTVVTQLTLDLSMSMESRGWIEHVRAPKVFKLTPAGAARAGRIRPVKVATAPQ